jgi:hypothetical protein
MSWTRWRRPSIRRWLTGVVEATPGYGVHGGDGRDGPVRRLVAAEAVQWPGTAGCAVAPAAGDTSLGLLPGFALLRNGQCCEDKIYLELGVAAEAAAWWQHNNAPGGDLITVGAIIALRVPVEELKALCPGRSIPGRPRFSRPGWADPGSPARG